MKRREMVKENQDFQEIIHNHRFLTNECFTIYQKSYSQSYPQFGIAVKKKFWPCCQSQQNQKTSS